MVHCPAHLAYGSEGKEGIPPDTDLLYELHLVEVRQDGSPFPKTAKKNRTGELTEEEKRELQIRRNRWSHSAPREGDMRTHFCVHLSIPVFLILAFASSVLYLTYALLLPDMEANKKRRRRKYQKKTFVEIKDKDEGKKTVK